MLATHLKCWKKQQNAKVVQKHHIIWTNSNRYVRGLRCKEHFGTSGLKMGQQRCHQVGVYGGPTANPETGISLMLMLILFSPSYLQPAKLYVKTQSLSNYELKI